MSLMKSILTLAERAEVFTRACRPSLILLPPFPPIISSHLPPGYCQFVLYFNVSGYILLACLFC